MKPKKARIEMNAFSAEHKEKIARKLKENVLNSAMKNPQVKNLQKINKDNLRDVLTNDQKDISALVQLGHLVRKLTYLTIKCGMIDLSITPQLPPTQNQTIVL